MDILRFMLSEFMGIAIMIIIGNGVVACLELQKTKSSGIAQMNWLGIGTGWGLAIFIGVMVSNGSDHQINPAATVFDLMQAIVGKGAYVERPVWWAILAIIAQFLGVMVGQLIINVVFWLQFKATTNGDPILAMHTSGPSIKEKTNDGKGKWYTKKTYLFAFLGEFFGTMILFGTVSIPNIVSKGTLNANLGSTGYLVFFAALAGATVFALVITTGGTTGPALNPARDLGPRIIHQILPIPNKRDSDWAYSWVPVAAPLLGAAIMGGIVDGLMKIYGLI